MMRTTSLLRHVASALALSLAACAPSIPRRAPPLPQAVSTPAPVPAPAPPEAAALVAAPAPAPPEAAALVAAPAPAIPAEPPEPAVPRERVRAVVLVYHMLGGMDTEMAVEPSAFEEQMRWLVDHRVPVVATSELASFLEGTRRLPERVAVIQIDDGHASVHRTAFPVLRRLGLPFTVALNTEALETNRREAMSWGAVRELVASGLCEIASHSHIHGHMERLTDARNQTEAEVSRALIEARTGVRPEAFVYPFGGNDARVRGTIEDAGYRLAFGVDGATARASSPRFAIPRVGVMRSTTLTSFARLFGVEPRQAKAASRDKRAPAG